MKIVQPFELQAQVLMKSVYVVTLPQEEGNARCKAVKQAPNDAHQEEEVQYVSVDGVEAVEWKTEGGKEWKRQRCCKLHC